MDDNDFTTQYPVADFRCPLCNYSLKADMERSFTTTAEHVFYNDEVESPERMTYICGNTTCATRGVLYWNETGETFVMKGQWDRQRLLKKVIGPNDAPYYSYQRQANIRFSSANRKNYMFGPFGIQVSYKLTIDPRGVIRAKNIRRLDGLVKTPDGSCMVVNPPIVDTFRQWKGLSESLRRLEAGVTETRAAHKLNIDSTLSAVDVNHFERDKWRVYLRHIIKRFYMKRLTALGFNVDTLK